MMDLEGSTKRKSFELDPRLLQLQNDLIKAEEERLPGPIALQLREEFEASTASCSWEPPAKRGRILGELDEEVGGGAGGDFGAGGPGEEAQTLEGLSLSRARGYKTQLCKFFPQGTCTKGEACSFAHGEHELNSRGGGGSMMAVMPGMAIMAGIMAGELAGEVQVPRGFKTQICKFYAMGNCGKGLRCTYAHGEHELVARTSNGRARPGPRFAVGGGTGRAPAGTGGGRPELTVYGTEFPMQLPRAFKTQLCKFFPLGQCQKGEICTYAHGEEELASGPGGCATQAAAAAGPQQGGALLALTDGSDGPIMPIAPGGSRGGSRHKTQPCKFFAVGKCTKGDQCTFIHNESQLAAGIEPVTQPGPQQQWPSGPSSRGSGTGGAVSRKYKTVPCKYFAVGKCQKGEACTFLHDEADFSGGSSSTGGFGKGGFGPGGCFGPDGFQDWGGCDGGFGGGSGWCEGGGNWGASDWGGGDWGDGGGGGDWGGDWGCGGGCGRGCWDSGWGGGGSKGWGDGASWLWGFGKGGPGRGGGCGKGNAWDGKAGGTGAGRWPGGGCEGEGAGHMPMGRVVPGYVVRQMTEEEPWKGGAGKG